MTLSALGIFSAAGVGGVPSFELISSTILGSTTATIDFTGLSAYSADYKHLQIRFSSKGTTTSRATDIRFNNVTTSSYSRHSLRANSSTVSSTNQTTVSRIPLVDATTGSTTANAFSGAIVDILDVYSTTKNKTIRSLFGVEDGSGYITLASGFLDSTSAIDSIQVIAGASFAIGSRFSIYGIKA
jgi:hypothetical protein